MKSKNRFTLIELLIVVAIISILASMILPALGKARKTAQSAVCKNNLRQLTVAGTMLVEDRGGHFFGWWYNDDITPYTGGYDSDKTDIKKSVHHCPSAPENDIGLGYSARLSIWAMWAGKSQGTPAEMKDVVGMPIVFFADTTAGKWVKDGNTDARHSNKVNFSRVDGAVQTLSQGLLETSGNPYGFFRP